MAKIGMVWNIPNLLTMLRIALIGVFLWQFTAGNSYVAMGVFLLASVTDFLDGYIARKYNQITSVGKLLDPLADKLMLITALICLYTVGRMPVWVVIVVVLKELIMIVGGITLFRKGVVVQAKFIGKVATVVFILAVAASFFHEYIAPWDTVLQYVAVTLSVSAMLWYFVETLQSIHREKKA